MIYGQYREDLKKIFRMLCKYKGVEILEGYFKEKSALMVFDANLKYKFGNWHFGQKGIMESTKRLYENNFESKKKECSNGQIEREGVWRFV